ncbi:TetR family transcriptional regulator [Rhodococcus sp. SRB_17]|nr:TetR family transcriptional regulator [Rhodococcus sp. SRB_17]
MTGKRLGPQDRREQIIVSAAKVFENKSYADVSMTELAKAAGVGRPLLNHYFGSKRDLYLDVVRRFVFIPELAVERLPGSTSAEKRVDAVIDRWLDVAGRHRGMWMSTVMSDDLRRDPEMDQILQDADSVAAQRMMDALDLRPSGEDAATVHAAIVAYGGLAKAASKQWLVTGLLEREQVHTLLVVSLLAIVRDVIPTLATDNGATTTSR